MNKCVIYNNIFNEPFSMPICPLRAYAEKIILRLFRNLDRKLVFLII